MSMLINPFLFAVASIDGPDSISGLRLWLKADGITGLSDDDEITTNWEDASGNNNDAQPQGVTVKPRWKASAGPNSMPAVNMGQSLGANGGWFNFAVTAATLMGSPAAGHGFSVQILDADPPPSNGRAGIPLGMFGDNSDEYFTFPSDGKIYDGFGSTARKTTVDPPSLTSWRLYENRSASGAWSNYLDGTLLFGPVANTVSWPATTPRIGSTSTNSKTLDGMIAEIIVYDKILDSTELTTLKAYITDKYALTLA